MVISPQGVSYMTAPAAAQQGNLDLRPDMVDFRRLFPTCSFAYPPGHPAYGRRLSR